MSRLLGLIFVIKTWIYSIFFNVEVCHNRNKALAPQSLLKSLPLAPSRPEDTSGVQAGWNSVARKDFNKDLGAGLDSLNSKLIRRDALAAVDMCPWGPAQLSMWGPAQLIVNLSTKIGF